MILRKLGKEWVLGLLFATVLLVFSSSSFVSRFDGWLYDAGQHLVRSPANPTEDIAIIHLDSASLLSLGGKAWERQALVSLLEKLRSTRADICILAPLDEAERNPALDGLEAMRAYVDSAKLPSATAGRLLRMIGSERASLDVDARLETMIRKLPHVILPLDPAKRIPEAVDGLAMDGVSGSSYMPDLLANGLSPLRPLNPGVFDSIGTPDSRFAAHASMLGTLNLLADADGRIRGLELLHEAQEKALPAVPLLLAAGKPSAVKVSDGRIRYGNTVLKTAYGWRGFLRFYPDAAFDIYPLSRVLADDFRVSHLKGKTIIIADDGMMRRQFPVAGGKMLSVAEITALATANLKNNDLYETTNMFGASEWALYLALAVLLILLFPHLRFVYCIIITTTGVLLLAGTTSYLLLTQQIWLKTGPAILLLAGGLTVVGLRRLYTSQSVRHLADVARTHRLLGLAYQEQGKMELAFESFKKLPPEVSNLELIYNLALDFERQRRYERAAAVYQHIMQAKPDFKDAARRRVNAEKLGLAALTSSGQFSPGILLLTDEEGEKPRLGRYQVEKEIGKGAMGAVYLGRDPKIDRVVAVKTLALSQEFEANELKEVEQRFFHEAAAAGRLNHPNIVTIYDAGEEHDLAYIAMEYLDGKPLSDFIQEKRLLPVPTVLNIIAQVAGGLDYAAKQGVVHRDIKPGNIMYNEKSGVVKITDFGIARVTSSSRTKTGTILGTPAYMSPEQITSQQVDGRTDIFSLGGTMFVLLTGKRPFSADSVASLTFQITSEKHQDPLKLRPELPSGVKTIIDKALQKDPENRYADGQAMRQAILRCLKSMQKQ